MLESKELPSLWPIRLILTRKSPSEAARVVAQNGQYLILAAPGEKLPLSDVARVLLDANTPRIPAEAETGLCELFSTLEAHGSHVTWGAPVPKPDLPFARVQLFATKFEYQLSFHVFVSALKNGSSIRVAEQNAFGKKPDLLEKEAADQLAAAHWEAAVVSGRPLDPKRDFGEHQVDGAYVAAYMAFGTLGSDPKGAEAVFKEAVESGGAAMALGYEGMAALAEHAGRDPQLHLEDAMRAGSTSAPVYVAAAKNRTTTEALSLLKKAVIFNPKWSEPIYQQSELQQDPAEKERLLKQAVALEPRRTELWIHLAQLQASNGHAAAAQGSWLRAAESAASPQEKQRIEGMHSSSEAERLNAAEAERVREREAAHQDDQKAENAELARIKAAEEKANKRLSASADEAPPEKVVPWEDMLPKKTVTGVLAKTECVHGGARLSVRDRGGRTLLLLLPDAQGAGFDCSAAAGSRRVTASYVVENDESAHTAGRILSIELR